MLKQEVTLDFVDLVKFSLYTGEKTETREEKQLVKFTYENNTLYINKKKKRKNYIYTE